jgi:hypothetical protein
MWLAAAMAVAMAGPNGLQALHSPNAEQARQEELVDRLGSIQTTPRPERKPTDPPTPAEKRAAARRADHLTCASPKGRTRAQFEAECKPVEAPNP